jgi:4-hydroxyphenylpyruvate dioxygenase
MTSREPLGIKQIEALQYYVHDLERTRRFLCDKLDFAEAGRSSVKLEQDGRQRAAVFEAGGARLVVCQPEGEGGRAWRYLRKHPEGVGTLVFEVEDIDKAFRLLDERGGTFITDVQRFTDEGGTLAMFSITTPFGDTTFRFVERKGYRVLFPGYEAVPASAREHESSNRFEFTHIDHVTSNFQTMQPALLWMEHVLGFERYWTVQFHTNDVAKSEAGSVRSGGSGLKSAVMWDPYSGVKFANNEPMRPFFKASQINIFGEDQRGDGVQHAALAVKDILSVVEALRKRGVEFMPTPGSYYDMLPERLERTGIKRIDEPVDLLRKLEVLVDGEREHEYLLQIFLKEAAGLHHDRAAGPFFFEIIQRKGDRGFGAGNFRALFESIEREQRAAGRL